jgi:hypothetical protein
LQIGFSLSTDFAQTKDYIAVAIRNYIRKPSIASLPQIVLPAISGLPDYGRNSRAVLIESVR